jgi:hypothetical protein
MKTVYALVKIKLYKVSCKDTPLKLIVSNGEGLGVIQIFENKDNCVEAITNLHKGEYEPNNYFLCLPFELED